MGIEYLLCVILMFAAGACILLVNFVKKHRWTRISGVISEVKNAGRSAAVCVEYQFNNQHYLSSCLVQKIEMTAYVKKIGQEIKITVSPKDPARIHIISTKAGYVAGVFFIIASLAIFSLYCVVRL